MRAAAEQIQEILLFGLGGEEVLDAGEDFRVAGAAARGAAREGDRREVFVAEVDEGAAFGGFDGLRGAEAGAEKLDGGHEGQGVC